jgi:hypothetical protein
VFAVAAILIPIGGWTLVLCLMDWEPSLGVFDLQALGEAIGHDAARWVVGGVGAALVLAGLLATL